GAAVMSDIMEKFSAAAEATRRSAATAAQQTREQVQRAAERSRSSVPAPSVPAQDKSIFCTNCGAALTEEDRFCGECGHPR
ncbi:MAG: zinc ribbon domain-containing protein, partial [Acidithiobacillus sp.]|nr:zinc ribbon domain-containing protein [Acidithiobacillus sp.]